MQDDWKTLAMVFTPLAILGIWVIWICSKDDE